jgi:hypothetical protein
MNHTKVALVFFGITRSLRFCYDSIKDKIFDELKKENISYDIYQHTYSLDNYENERTGEKLDTVDNNEYKILQADFVMIENQDEIKKKLNLKQYRTHKDPWKGNYNSVDNMILGHYSKKQATTMIENSGIQYDYIIFIRPDCLYLNKLNLNFIKEANNKTIVMPNFHCHSQFRINDRFAITTMNNYKIYGCIFDKLLDISKKMPLHSEHVLGLILKNNKINIKKIKFHFRRIRCEGNICSTDRDIK